eukprot:CAMPEP_0181205386 /NCGR_PEP_ID=MMETSP1096-20121128/20447_1 /TAXON_ID=156174 ORGANISM="Chrysochromulina ericina, Strain CCMP281" /NCGR_SAMPLE_ID=MMETSP1096 /ASSEMBLY_ACC=CAM_ASM_000453 /LENGTH=305 /DNA_ID=CAMNT_0023296161 /DNA_START=330 /DNA_END=1248 /DNA_ORIENTATION=+
MCRPCPPKPRDPASRVRKWQVLLADQRAHAEEEAQEAHTRQRCASLLTAPPQKGDDYLTLKRRDHLSAHCSIAKVDAIDGFHNVADGHPRVGCKTALVQNLDHYSTVNHGEVQTHACVSARFREGNVISTAAGAGATAGCVKSGFTVDLPPRVALPAACPPSLAFSPPAAPPPRAPSTAAPALLDASMLPPPFSELETGFTAPMRAASACFLQKSINWTELSLVNAGLVPMPAMKLGLERSARSWTVDTTLGSSVSSVCRQWRTSSTEKTSERSALTGAKLASYATLGLHGSACARPRAAGRCYP